MDDFKTGFSMTIKSSTKKRIIEAANELHSSQADIGRLILEYFFEHNDIEDLKA